MHISLYLQVFYLKINLLNNMNIKITHINTNQKILQLEHILLFSF